MGAILAVIAAFAASVLFGVLFSIPSAWIVMLVLGALHATYPAVPAMGFWLVLITVFAVSLVFGASSSASTD